MARWLEELKANRLRGFDNLEGLEATKLRCLEKLKGLLRTSEMVRSEIEAKISLESNLGPNLMLSLLERLNFGVKIAKLTQFGWLSGTKWALGEPLERSKSLQERPKASTGSSALNEHH